MRNYGTLVANPKADQDNAMRSPKCDPCTGIKMCQDTIEGDVPAGASLVGIVYDQVEEPLKFDAVDVTDNDAVLRSIYYCIKPCEKDISIGFTLDGASFSFTHIGQSTISGLIFSDGTTETTVDTATRLCDLRNECTYRLNLVGEVADLSYAGNTETLANNPYDFTGTPATDLATAAQLKADIETALTALGQDFISVEVVADADSETFQVDVLGDINTLVGDKCFQHCGCEEKFYDGSGDASAKVATKSLPKVSTKATKVVAKKVEDKK